MYEEISLRFFLPMVAFSWTTAVASPVFDIDDDGEIKALTDGLLTIRFLFGFEGESLTSGAISADAQRKSPEEISAYLHTHKEFLDIDGDGQVKLSQTASCLFDHNLDSLVSP